MKNNIFIFMISFVVLYACKSEYSERMHNAKLLKAEYVCIEKDCIKPENHKLQYYLDVLKNKIKKEAKISGNEEFFLKEIDCCTRPKYTN
jgi:hypothetical protein